MMEDITVKLTEQCKIVAKACTEIGTRTYQQDCFKIVEGTVGTMAVVCDGMGGLQGGEIASEKAVEEITKAFLNKDKIEDIPTFLLDEARKMDLIVFNLTDDDGNKLEAGTTVVAIIAVDDLLYWLSVGDSKIYIVRGSEMICVTREHNYRLQLDKQLQSGIIDEEAYYDGEKQWEALTSYLGMNGLAMLDLTQVPFQMQQGDRVVLCSDGVYKVLSDEILIKILTENPIDSQEAANAVVNAVLQSGKKNLDNTTIIVGRYE